MRKKGLTIVELTVAMGILAIVLTMSVYVISIFIENQQYNTIMRNTQQNARQAVELIAKEARQATETPVISATGDTITITNSSNSGSVGYVVTYQLSSGVLTRKEVGDTSATAITDPAFLVGCVGNDCGANPVFSFPNGNTNLVKIQFAVSNRTGTKFYNQDSTQIVETVYVNGASQ